MKMSDRYLEETAELMANEKRLQEEADIQR
jgi:hypothetical protein